MKGVVRACRTENELCDVIASGESRPIRNRECERASEQQKDSHAQIDICGLPARNPIVWELPNRVYVGRACKITACAVIYERPRLHCWCVYTSVYERLQYDSEFFLGDKEVRLLPQSKVWHLNFLYVVL